jgi:uncharacterized protein (TIGR02246 family)
MKSTIKLSYGIALAMLSSPGLQAQDQPSPEIAGLQKAAAEFVLAYNNKDSAAISALFTENGEMTDITSEDIISGRAEIKAHYDEVFSGDNIPEAAVEVASVRLVTPTVAIEDGTFHLDPPGEATPIRSTKYTAVLVKGESGAWQIASTRDLQDVSDAGGELSDVAEALKGDWTCQKEGVRMDFAFGWDDSGRFMIGNMLTTTNDSEPMSTSIRIGWDGARKTITFWAFDSNGGYSKGDWTPIENGWLIHTEGSSADAEATSATANFLIEGENTLVWKGSNRVVNGEQLPNAELRIVRQAPEPDSDSAAE